MGMNVERYRTQHVHSKELQIINILYLFKGFSSRLKGLPEVVPK